MGTIAALHPSNILNSPKNPNLKCPQFISNFFCVHILYDPEDRWLAMAIEIVCLTTLAVGARQMSARVPSIFCPPSSLLPEPFNKFGAIVSRLTAIEDMAGMNMLCSDKTGTRQPLSHPGF